MASKLGIYNGALMHIGETLLASLSEVADRRRKIDAVYNDALAFALEQGLWNFAKRAIQSTASVSVEPQFGFTYAHQKPDDWVRTAMISDSERFTDPLANYEDEAGWWYTDVDPLYVSFVSSHTSYGGDLGKWPATFTEYFKAYLASVACESIRPNQEKLESLQKLAKRYLSDARSKDAMNEPRRHLPTGSWVRARLGGSTRSRNHPYR